MTRPARTAAQYLWRKWANAEWLDQHAATLEQLSDGSLVTIEQPRRKQLQLQACGSRSAAENLRATFGGKIEKLPRDWLTRFTKSIATKPIRVGARLLITNAEGRNSCRPSSDATSVAIPSLAIPAGAAFGTGEHATTAMSLRMLERLTRPHSKGWRMLDAGTGSGILALAGWRFGAREIVAIDNDPTAIATARENARANRIAGVKFVVGDVKQTTRGRFGIITANLYADLLAEMLPKFSQRLACKGRLIVSGVLRQQEPELMHSLRASCFEIEETRRRGKWIALVAKHSGKEKPG